MSKNIDVNSLPSQYPNQDIHSKVQNWINEQKNKNVVWRDSTIKSQDPSSPKFNPAKTRKIKNIDYNVVHKLERDLTIAEHVTNFALGVFAALLSPIIGLKTCKKLFSDKVIVRFVVPATPPPQQPIQQPTQQPQLQPQKIDKGKAKEEEEEEENGDGDDLMRSSPSSMAAGVGGWGSNDGAGGTSSIAQNLPQGPSPTQVPQIQRQFGSEGPSGAQIQQMDQLATGGGTTPPQQNPAIQQQQAQPPQTNKRYERMQVENRYREKLGNQGYDRQGIDIIINRASNLANFILNDQSEATRTKKEAIVKDLQTANAFPSHENVEGKILGLAIRTELLFNQCGLGQNLPSQVSSKISGKHKGTLIEAPYTRLIHNQGAEVLSDDQNGRMHLIKSKALGGGTFNTTWASFDVVASTQKEFSAFRSMKEEHLQRQDLVAQWEGEVDAHKKLQDMIPGMIKIRQIVRLDKPVFDTRLGNRVQPVKRALILEKADGDLRALRGGKLKDETQISMAAQLADTIAHLHSFNLTHGDLKTENVFFKGDETRLGDFGTIKNFGQRQPWEGTQAFQPPEAYFIGQRIHPQVYDAGIDNWALGMIIYDLKYQDSLAYDFQAIAHQTQILDYARQADYDTRFFEAIAASAHSDPQVRQNAINLLIQFTRNPQIGSLCQQWNNVFSYDSNHQLLSLTNLNHPLYTNVKYWVAQANRIPRTDPYRNVYIYNGLIQNYITAQYNNTYNQKIQRLAYSSDPRDQAIVGLLNPNVYARWNAAQAALFLKSQVQPQVKAGPFAGITNEMAGWLDKYALFQFPNDFAPGSRDAILRAVSTAQSDGKFKIMIDDLYKRKLITFGAVNGIKRAFEKRVAKAGKQQKANGAQNLPQVNTSFAIPPIPLNLQVCVREINGPLPDPQNNRWDARDATRAEVVKMLGDNKVYDFKRDQNSDSARVSHTPDKPTKLFQDAVQTALKNKQFSKELVDDLKKVTLYEDKSVGKEQTASKKELLGRCDVVAVPCQMKYGADFKKNQSKNKFYMHYAAAPNIGEKNATDFVDFSIGGKGTPLNEAKYLTYVNRIFGNELKAQKASGAADAVWFPLGMGAFLRELPQHDNSYNFQKLGDLRKKIAEEFVKQLDGNANLDMNIHLCLVVSDEESKQNFNAFMEALSKAPATGNVEKLKNQGKIKIYINKDATEKAQELVDQNGEYTASLANGANRGLLGNHYYSNGAARAIDENIHRRSPASAAVAAVLNDETSPKQRGEDELKNRIQQFGGKVV